jgi:hypothetical protein
VHDLDFARLDVGSDDNGSHAYSGRCEDTPATSCMKLAGSMDPG